MALSVDGLNTIDARRTTAVEAAKWVVKPGRTITVDGWQVSGKTARRFVFTTEAASYGAWLGETGNLGLVSAAVFREREAEVTVWPGLGARQSRPDADSPARESESKSLREERQASPPAQPSDELAATGIGRETSNPVRQVRLELETGPAAVLQLRYEYHDALVRLGVLPPRDRLDRRERATGFEDLDFAPDPYR